MLATTAITFKWLHSGRFYFNDIKMNEFNRDIQHTEHRCTQVCRVLRKCPSSVARAVGGNLQRNEPIMKEQILYAVKNA